MAADDIALAEGATPERRLRRDWPRRLLNELLSLFIALLVLLAVALVLLDTAPGHRFILDRLAGFRDRVRPESADRPDRRVRVW